MYSFKPNYGRLVYFIKLKVINLDLKIEKIFEVLIDLKNII